MSSIPTKGEGNGKPKGCWSSITFEQGKQMKITNDMFHAALKGAIEQCTFFTMCQVEPICRPDINQAIATMMKM